jgi:hypothetical protein
MNTFFKSLPLHKLYKALPVLAMAALVGLTGCDKDDDCGCAAKVNDNKVVVQFDNKVGGLPLILDTEKYVSPAGDTFKLGELKYYISNVSLRNAITGKVYTEDSSYHLIDVNKGKTSFTLNSIPQDVYDEITFHVGVDPVANKKTDQVGDLDPETEMAWNWNTGYKFMVATGKYYDQGVEKGLVFHVGSDDNYKKVTLNFPVGLKLPSAKTKNMIITSNVNQLFENPNLIDFNQINSVMGGPNAAKIAENYANGMFSVTEIKD